MEPLASELLAQRLREGLSQADMTEVQMAHRLADRLGTSVDPTIISRIVARTRPVGLDEAAIIAEELGLSLLELISDSPAGDIDERVTSLWAERAVAEARMVRADAVADHARDDMIHIDQTVRKLIAQRPHVVLDHSP